MGGELVGKALKCVRMHLYSFCFKGSLRIVTVSILGMLTLEAPKIRDIYKDLLETTIIILKFVSTNKQ